MSYTKMVISGGGINGIAIVGAISEFSNFYDINNIKEGVSNGEINMSEDSRFLNTILEPY